MATYKDLNFIDKLRYKWRVRKAEKLEDKRQALEHDDRQAVDRQKIIDELYNASQNKKNNVKALPEPQEVKLPVNEFDNRYRVDLNKVEIPAPPKGTIEHALEQYLMATTLKAQENGIYNPYKTLTNLSGLSDKEAGNNFMNEVKLIQNLDNRASYDKDFNVLRQNGSNGEPVFYHVKKNANGRPDKRIYLNCKKANIAQLAGSLIQNFEDMDSYYLKLSSNAQAQEMDRAEQIVIYVKDDAQLNNFITRIRKTKEQNPQLFEKSEHINPFLRNYDGYIAVANESQAYEIDTLDENGNNKKITKSVYNKLNGEHKSCERSYNSLLSTALEDSMVNGINDLLTKNADFRNKIGNLNISRDMKDNAEVYALSILPEIIKDDKVKMQLITSMKANLKEISKNNPDLDIKGIPNAKEQEMNLQLNQK